MSHPLFNAKKRLLADLHELDSCEGICAVNAAPLEKSIFEWHVNLAPTDGPYKGTLLHLIMVFPKSYPRTPPKVRLCTHIEHPNVFGEDICLDVLKPYTTTTPYEGWSTAYSATSILLQLQTFLFAENVPQDHGGAYKRDTHWEEVAQAKRIAAEFVCQDCGHTSRNPWPPLRDSVQLNTAVSSSATGSKLFKGVVRMRSRDALVDPDGLTLKNQSIGWMNSKSTIGICPPQQSPYKSKAPYLPPRSTRDPSGKRRAEYRNYDFEAKGLPRGIYYEATVLNNHGIGRFGWGSRRAGPLGMNDESFGYGGTGKISISHTFKPYGEEYGGGDTITCILDFKYRCAYFAKNGRGLDGWKPFKIPDYLWYPRRLFPQVSFKDCKIKLNFGPARCPIKDSYFRGYVCVEHYLNPPSESDSDDTKVDDIKVDKTDITRVSRWHEMSVDTLVSAFLFLSDQDLYRVGRVCVLWRRTVERYSLIGRLQTRCFHTKVLTYENDILGVGVSIKRFGNSGVAIKEITAGFDLLSATAFDQGVRTGPWGNPIEEFLPLAINKKHAKRAEARMKLSFRRILQKGSGDSPEDAVEVLSTVMNSTVVSLCMGSGSEGLKRHASEKAFLGYCAFHHLLLFLADRNPEIETYARRKIRAFKKDANARNKSVTPDLGRFLILLALTDRYAWRDIRAEFVSELFARNVRWILKDTPQLANITQSDRGGHANHRRLDDTLANTVVSRRLVMFQVHFLTTIGRQRGKTMQQILSRYNRSFGRPSRVLSNELQKGCREILSNCKDWKSFFTRIHMENPSPEKLTCMLVKAVQDSAQKRYHRKVRSRW